ncbi:histidine kinase [Nocardioides KLBMP 9356]|uniref:Oxygen sensor histidine kinase NreB n=1 Tax=Nocardioides potassii TaxID=2911371 RepID=A0ABS9HG81_9ACTN|nr:ATP-binding protein [Nocardioides potassii]MCF6379366.1 histidine kinase [Nocardioides potassii]
MQPASPPRSRPVTAGAALAAVPGIGGGVLALVLAAWHGTWDLAVDGQVPVDAVVAIAYPMTALVVLSSSALRRGARALAWILMVAGGCSGVATLSTVVAQVATEPSTATDVAVLLLSSVWVPGFLSLLTLVPLFYPDGLLPGRLWRLAAGAAVIGIALLTLGLGLYPETFEGRIRLPKPVSHLGIAQGLTYAGAALLLPAGLAGVASLVVRLVRTRGLARRQVIVFLAAAALLIAVTVTQGSLPSPVDILAQAVAAAMVPIAIGVAITRHGLYEMDVAVRRSLVAVSLGTCLAGAYLTLFALLQALPRHESALSAAVAAGLTGAIMQPLAKRLTAGVDRMFYGDRADPFAVTSALAGRLTEAGLDVALVPQVLCDTVVETLRLPAARVWLAGDSSDRPVATAGAVGDEPPAEFELRHRGDVVAELDVWPRAGEQGLHPRDELVVRGLADQVAPAVAAVQLHRQLQRSREALVAAREDERLQLRRDLHDGLGATLAGLRLQVETAQYLSDQPDVDGLLGSAGDGVAQAVAEVRAITDGLRPAALDELGLARALSALADRVRAPGLEVEVDIAEHVAAAPAVEVALHRIAAEALANAVRHSGARRLSLRVRDGRHVELHVSDDGVGLRAGADATAGSGLGLASMRQRAEEVGGTLELLTSDSGTTVHALLPHSVGDLT